MSNFSQIADQTQFGSGILFTRKNTVEYNISGLSKLLQVEKFRYLPVALYRQIMPKTHHKPLLSLPVRPDC